MGASTKSGTSLETRGASGEAGELFQSVFEKARSSRRPEDLLGVFDLLQQPFRVTSQSLANQFGIAPGQLSGAVSGGLQDPADATRGLFAAQQPFQARAQSEALRNVGSLFGSGGARFSGNVGQAGASAMAQLQQGFDLNRAQALLDANAQRNQFTQGLLGFGAEQANTGLGAVGQALGFIQPGPPVIQQGAGSSLLGLAGTLGGAFLGGPGGAFLGRSIFGGGGGGGFPGLTGGGGMPFLPLPVGA